MAFTAPEKLKVVYCAPGKMAEVIEVDNSVDAIERLLNDHIEIVKYPLGDYVLVCCDCGGPDRLPNRSLRGFSTVMDKIIGPFFVCNRVGGAGGNFVSLTEEEIKKFLSEFGEPETF